MTESNEAGSFVQLKKADALAFDAANAADGETGTGFMPTGTYNGATFDRFRGNIEGTALASAARIATVNSADITNYNHRGGHIAINVTAVGSTSSIVPTIQGRTGLSQYYSIMVGPTITTTGVYAMRVYPSLTSTTSQYANDILPRSWRVSVAHANVDTVTYSVSYSLVL